MAFNFIKSDRNQDFLLPPSLRDWLPPGDLAWLVIDAVSEMDISAFYKKYRKDGTGHEAFDPAMMVTLLLYAYSVGVRSSRRIEQLCERDIAFRVIATNLVPDHCTISRFRKENGLAISGLFTQILKLCHEAGLVKLGVVALDGTKMKADAALDSNRTYDHIKQEVENMLADADANDLLEDALYGSDKRGDELPEELSNPTSRKARLGRCKKQLEERAAAEAADKQAKIDKRKAEEDEAGKKKRGRKPKEPDSEPESGAKANITDPDSRIMKGRSGYVQGFNGQAVVTEGQIIIAAALTDEANDVNQLHPMMLKAQENLTVMDPEAELKIKVNLADAGYMSEDNLSKIDPSGPEHIIATRKDWKQRKEEAEAPPPRGRIPKGLTPKQLMDRKLLTKRGKNLYKKRGKTVEPVFGQIKNARGIRHFLRRGLEACAQEWNLICSTHNLLKLWRSCKGIAAQMAV